MVKKIKITNDVNQDNRVSLSFRRGSKGEANRKNNTQTIMVNNYTTEAQRHREKRMNGLCIIT
jgi:hypothetical protein